MNPSNIVGIYLAAGKSSRMASSKLNLPVGHEYLGGMALREALESKLDSILVITRKSELPPWLIPFSTTKGWRRLQCPEAELGLSASLKTGVKEAIQIGATGVLILLADQPFVTTKMINHLMNEFQSTNLNSYISYSNNGLIQAPVLFSKKTFPMLLQLTGDQGARRIIRGELRKRGKQIEFNNDRPFIDIDTVEDYDFLLNHLQFGHSNQNGDQREDTGELYWEKYHSKRGKR